MTSFSIIIPIYNNAPFLQEAINSVLDQSYKHYEIILIDDGSTDGSYAICNEYEQRYENIHCIKISHSGPGAARNAGIAAAVGDYILFIDADDYWRDIELLRKIDHQIRYRKAEVVMYQMIQVTEQGILILSSRKSRFPDTKSTFLLKEIYPALVKSGQVVGSAWNKCVSRKVLMDNQISFPEGTTGEDIDWVFQLFSSVRTICFLNEEAYAYRQYKSDYRASYSKDGAHNLAVIIRRWAEKLKEGSVPNHNAVAGLLAFEYGIFMGYSHQVSAEERKLMRNYQYLLSYGLDRKTKMIARFHKCFGYRLTCFAIRCYLLGRQLRR